MNRRIIALLLAAVLLLAACGKKNNAAETTEPTIETTEAATISTLPGIIYTPENIGGALTEEEDTTPTSEATEPKEETEPTVGEEEKPTEAPVVPTTEYEKYNAMSGEEQEAFIDSFESIQAFMDWYNAAKAEYDALHPGIDIGDGNIDAGDLIGGNG